MKVSIADLIRAAYKKRRAVLNPFPAAYRLFNSADDGLAGMIIDMYGEYAAISWYSPDVLESRLAVSSAIEENFHSAAVYELYRFNSPGAPQKYNYIRGVRADEFFIIEELGVKFLCSFEHGQNTGFFIDNRSNRRLIYEMVRGRRVLNLFSYTGVLSVIAAAGGASDVTSVDISPAYNRWAAANLDLNSYGDFSRKVLKFDAFDYMNFCAKKGREFDFIIIDPPPFAVKLAGRAFAAKKDYHKLLSAALKITPSGGVILVLCNAAEYKRCEFASMLDSTLRAARGEKGFKINSGPSMPPDFISPVPDKSSDYLKNYYIKIL